MAGDMVDTAVLVDALRGDGYHDCLIAAMAVNRKALLYTPNLKHMNAVEELKLRRPY